MYYQTLTQQYLNDAEIYIDNPRFEEYKNGKKNRMHYAGDGSGNPLLVLRK